LAIPFFKLMNIQKALSTDLIEALYLVKTCLHEFKGWLYADLNHFLANNHFKEAIVFLYKENEVCRGMISLIEGTPKGENNSLNGIENKSFEVNCLAVHPNWRHQGIAKSLIAFAEKYAKEQGYASLTLSIFAENEEAVDLYSKLEYKQSGETLSSYQKVPFICFEKDLKV
jgi:ribosomal protein S18 acetylase RimI-like enzyme